jgi:hypothetical protein
MDPELKKELDEIQALEKDNHRMLKTIRRGQWFSTFWTILVWALAISLPFYLYQQYLQPIVSRYYVTSGTATTTTGMFGLPTFAQVQKLINSFKAGK